MKLAVIGRDVSKSDSPAIHNFILGSFHEPCSYEKVSIPPEEFSKRAEELFEMYDGFNVTIPFKGEILPFLKELRGDAKLFGAVNTVVADGRLGYNTDGYGFMCMLKNAGVEVKGADILVLGAGGAGRSCIKKLSDVANVYAYERSAARLEEVYGELGGFTPLSDVPLRKFDVILNCTGVGMHESEGKTPEISLAGKKVPVGEELLSRTETAVDLIYVPRESEFLRIARTLGKKTVNGAAMLFYQAYMADCIFLGRQENSEEAKALFRQFSEVR